MKRSLEGTVIRFSMPDIFYEKEITCLSCQSLFKTYRVRLKAVRIVSIDSDFCPHYRMRRKVPCFSTGDIRRSPLGESFVFSITLDRLL
ncbi:DUF2225 domain-containing protein [Sulfoacidibacillus thermotolerans]|uniref:DUF2225 domain-containing protein n=1 Tax=Sulfoacidibacillus thermotolerans TaxID=1765684 RepID=UPI000D686A41